MFYFSLFPAEIYPNFYSKIGVWEIFGLDGWLEIIFRIHPEMVNIKTYSFHYTNYGWILLNRNHYWHRHWDQKACDINLRLPTQGWNPVWVK